MVLLKDSKLLCIKGFIDGEWVDADGRGTFAVKNPYTGEVVAHMADLGVEETRRAIRAAQRAFETWSIKPPLQRADILRK